MRILWFTHTPAAASAEFGYTHAGAGWITSLQQLLTEKSDCTLGICFFYDGFAYKKITIDGVAYFGMPLKKGNALMRLLNRHGNALNDEDSTYIEQVIREFAPDIIQVFGTEVGYGKIIPPIHRKTIFHLQGLLTPITESFFPRGITIKNTIRKDSLADLARGISIYHLYKWFVNRTKREQEIVRQWTYFMGRTDWDRNYIEMLNPSAVYFHCEELLRKAFYETTWQRQRSSQFENTFVLTSTINPNMYKGLDLIYRTLPLLEGKKIQWNILGIREDSSLNKTIRRILNIKKTPAEMIFHGPVGEAELVDVLTRSDVFVHPSYIDNSPNSVCEAMLMGMPVLASSVGGVPSLISHKESGILFNPYDRYDLAGWIHQLMTFPEKGVEYGQKARQVALGRHDPEQILDSLLKTYKQVIENTG